MLSLACENCGTTFTRRHRQRFCGLTCRSRFFGRQFRGENQPTFKGRVAHANGYIRVFVPGHPIAGQDGYVLEHRLVLYAAGVPLPAGHHVHHVNHDKTDNRIENLQVLTVEEHKRIHPSHDGQIQNQHGTWAVMSPEERATKQRARLKVWRAANKDKIRAYKDARRAAGLPY